MQHGYYINVPRSFGHKFINVLICRTANKGLKCGSRTEFRAAILLRHVFHTRLQHYVGITLSFHKQFSVTYFATLLECFQIFLIVFLPLTTLWPAHFWESRYSNQTRAHVPPIHAAWAVASQDSKYHIYDDIYDCINSDMNDFRFITEVTQLFGGIVWFELIFWVRWIICSEPSLRDARVLFR